MKNCFAEGISQEILGFNEPDQEGHQSDLTPDEAAAAWVEMQEKFPDQVSVCVLWGGVGYIFPSTQALVAPGVSSTTNGWFDEFMEACEALGCRLRILIHLPLPNTG